MQLSIDRNDTLAVNNDYIIIWIELLTIQRLLGCVDGEHQRSVNDFPSYTFGIQRAALSHSSEVNVLVASIGNQESEMLVAAS